MIIRILLAAAMIAAAPAVAKEKPSQKPAAAVTPVVTYEMQDSKMGEAVEQVCMAEPASVETYDAKDNMLIVEVADGRRAFLHLQGGCDVSTLMFASRIEGGHDRCVSVGDVLTVTASTGTKTCEITAINVWLPGEPISEYDTPY